MTNRKRKLRRKKGKTAVAHNFPTTIRPLVRRSVMDFVVADPRLKIWYFIPHRVQDLSEASPFGMYTPGLHSTCDLMRFAATLPGDVREPYTNSESILLFRLRRLLWRNIRPAQIDALQELSRLSSAHLFRVIITNDSEIANIVDRLEFRDHLPFLHISSVAAEGRTPIDEVTQDTIISFAQSVLARLSESDEWQQFVRLTEDAMTGDPNALRGRRSLPGSFHNVATPNEIALLSFGWMLEGEDPLVPMEGEGAHFDPGHYIGRICALADQVSEERRSLSKNFSQELVDNKFLVTVPSAYWGFYGTNQDLRRDMTEPTRRAIRLAYRFVLRQESYFAQLDVDEVPAALKDDVFKSIMGSWQADQACYTTGLSLLSAQSLSPVLRIEPKINSIRGNLKILGHCARSESTTHKQFKESRLAREIAKGMRAYIDDQFLQRWESHGENSRIEGLKLVADLPLEWLPCCAIPLGLRYDVSRIPVLPGNLFLANCVEAPVILHARALSEILVIRSFAPGDPLTNVLETAIEHVTGTLRKGSLRIQVRDIATSQEFVDALNEFEGGLLIFDGHGHYETKYGVGTLSIAGTPADLWELKAQCRFPPIVIFSACDTHPIDGSHGSAANAAFVLGAKTVLATMLPINAGYAALFIGRLMLRIAEFVPTALEMRSHLTWREVVSGMLRMEYATEITLLLGRHGRLNISDYERVQMTANTAINSRQADWFEKYLDTLAEVSQTPVEELYRLHSIWASLTDAQKYVQLGSPENIVIVPDAPS